MPDKTGPRNFFSLLRELDQSLLDLRLKTLPHPALLMLAERGAELQAAIRFSAQKTYKRRRQAEEKNWHEPLIHLKQTLGTTKFIFNKLRTVRKEVETDLAIAESLIRYNQYPTMIQAIKQRLRALGRNIEKKLETLPPDQVFNNTEGFNDIAHQIVQLAKAIAKLNHWADKKIATYYTEFDTIFTLLEVDPVMSDTKRDVEFELRSIAYKNISASGLFDENFYLNQLPKNSNCVRNALKMYLTKPLDYFPCQFFNDTFYMEQSDCIKMLRYNPLEHFARYGESMRLSPSPELDIQFYLKNNEDVLNAGISPYRHFINHGLSEGRPPSIRAGNFLSKQYMDCDGVRLAFVGDPNDEEKLAWDILRRSCENRKNGLAVSVSIANLSNLSENFNGFVVGANALSSLNESLLSTLAHKEVSLVYLGGNPQKDLQKLFNQSTLSLTKVCALTYNYERFLRWQEGELPIKILYYPFENAKDSLPVTEAILSKLVRKEEFTLRRFARLSNDANSAPTPVISVVSIIYKKPDEMLTFLESINRQDIARPYEVILVDDASPDDTVDRVYAWLEEKRQYCLLNRHMDIRILRNEVNSGNCISRNKGIETAKSKIVLVADGDMAFGTSNLSEHVWAYRHDDCDAVIGFFRFDLNKEFIFDWLAACEIDHEIINKKLLNIKIPSTAYGKMQFLGTSVFDYVTRNLSFKKSIFNNEYFDPDFSYSSKPNSGYGGEDQEFGAKVYFSGGRTRFAERAIAIHTRHGDNSYNDSKVLANLRNWEKLFAKYPDLIFIDRQCYQAKTSELLDRTSFKTNAPEHISARARYTAPHRANVTIRHTRPLKILTYKWHSAHQYELFKIGQHAFTLATNIGTLHCNQWAYEHRPLPRNARFVPLEDINPNEYDLAILPFDEHVLFPEHCKALSPEWGNAFLTMLDLTKAIPRVALCHGTPQIYETESALNDGHALGEVITGSREALRQLLCDIHVVCNSYQAQREWAFSKSSVIWHGFSPTEFPPGKHTRDCLTLPRKAFESRPVNRGEAIRRLVANILKNCILEYSTSANPDYKISDNPQEWAMAKFQKYVDYIGDFTIYFNPTVHSPMPRSRDEAMMTGTIPVSLRNHDVDMFIQNGKNGFYSDSPEELAEQIMWIIDHEKERRKISRNARVTAMDIFNIDRYLDAWSALIQKTI